MPEECALLKRWMTDVVSTDWGRVLNQRKRTWGIRDAYVMQPTVCSSRPGDHSQANNCGPTM